MTKSNLYKYLSLIFIVIIAQILLSMIEGQIEDRANNRDHARLAIKKSWTGDQTILAAVLTVPYKRSKIVRIFNQEKNQYVDTIKWTNHKVFVLPEELAVTAKLQHQVLSKGIYDVPVYTASTKLAGYLNRKKLAELASDPRVEVSATGYLSIGISDTRGIVGSPSILVGDKPATVSPGTKLDFFTSGFSGEIEWKTNQPQLDFNINMQVKGMGRIGFITTAKENRIQLDSDWPHPSFDGAFLPTNRNISADGYSAVWKTGVFSTDIENTMEQCFKKQCDYIDSSEFGVNHIQAVDIYLKSLRSVKYGLLVVIITFTLFVLYEVLNKTIKIHPVSYSLTGMSLAMFFLLLIALSEHIRFSSAYWISSIACSGLIGYYVSHLSRSKQHGVSMFGLLNGFYLVLFFIIRSEDHALLSGSILLFVLLTMVMVITRKIDWYQIGTRE